MPMAAFTLSSPARKNGLVASSSASGAGTVNFPLDQSGLDGAGAGVQRGIARLDREGEFGIGGGVFVAGIDDGIGGQGHEPL